MDIKGRTAWTVSKDGQAICLSIEDIQQLLARLASLGDLVVSDEASGRSGSGAEAGDLIVSGQACGRSGSGGEEVGVSLNDDADELDADQ